MKRNLKYIIPLGIVLLFIITNPSITAFKEYQGRSSYYGLKRSLNLFVLSEYKDGGNEFIGVFGNFIKLEKPKPMIVIETDSAKMDSAKMADTTVKVDSSIHYDEYGIRIRKK